MKWLTTATVVSVFAAAVPALAQDQQLLRMDMIGICQDSQSLHQVLKEQYGEIPVASGLGHVVLSDIIPSQSGAVRLYTNPQTYTFSVAIEFPDKISCVLATGDHFGPILQDKGI